MRTPALLFTLLFLTSATAAQAADVVVPEALKPWIPWALHGHEAARCPLIDGTNHRCAWPGPLDLVVGGKGGTFEQRWTLLREERVPLPGSRERWPQDVTVDGKKAVVVDDGGAPGLTIGAGEHVVRGTFSWDERPESLAIAPETALLTLSVGGRAVVFPRRSDGNVSFDKDDDGDHEEREADSVDVAIFRKVIDDAPLLVETRLVIDVAGKAREITVDNALLKGFEAALVSGPVPVRVEGTSLRAQVRPGSHTVVVVGRSTDKGIALAGPAASDDGPAEEIWVYEARPALRVAHVDAVSIAADQTRLPAEWRTLPAYRVLPGEAFALVEDRRGDTDAPPSELSIYRTLWLDFDGNGATVKDQLSGSFTGDRLEMGDGTALGHVAVSGRDAFITTLSKAGDAGARPGVEVRQRSLNVVAESRIEHALSSFPAVSWAHDFQGASIDLQLPPGYSLVSASGVDSVSDTWVQRWTLFEIFLVLVLVTAILRLWGPLLAGIAGAAFVLTFQEADAPIASWCFVVVLAGLHKALPESVQQRRAVRLLAYLRVFVAVIVALITLSFAVQQVRQGMYPTLAQPWRSVGDGAPGQRYDDDDNSNFDRGFGRAQAMATMAPMAPPPPPMPVQAEQSEPKPSEPADEKDARRNKVDSNDGEYGEGGGGEGGGGIGGLLSSSKSVAPMRKMKPKKQMTTVDPDAVVQTGPGLPRWGWQSVTLTFSGPVKADQTIELWLVSPTMNLLLAFARVFLLALLVAAAFGLPGGRWPRAVLHRFRGRGAVWLSVFAVLVSSLSSTSAAAQVVPDAEVLDELRERLLAPPVCGDHCVQIPRLRVDATATSLRLAFEVHADADVAVPLPADDDQWTPRSILVDGKAANAVRAGGHLLVRVGKGVHDVVVEGPLPPRASVALSLPMVPRQGSFSSTSWLLDGIHEDGVVDGNLQLTRLDKAAAGADANAGGDLPPSVLPPFLLVERTVMIGLTFEVETRVVRLSPAGSSIVIDVPLLAGESVTTDGVRAEQKDGKGLVKVSLGPTDTETSWRSTLAQTETLTLTAPTSTPWLESWQIQESPLWHVTRKGIPTIAGVAVEGTATFRPWPGETLALQLVRPTGTPGQTVTIDEVKLNVNPGLRSTDATLVLELRASRGGQHLVTLPADTELLSSTINGQPATLRPAKNIVTVPLSPGSQRIELHLRLPGGVLVSTSTPTIDIGKDAVNVELGLDLPQDRWVLFVHGPRTGPAVLFWSFLIVIVVVGGALSRVPVSPLKLHQWVLLSLGLTQVPVPVAALVAGWLLMLGWRQRSRWSTPGETHDFVFDLFQLLLVGWTVVAVIGLGASVKEGLAGSPEMQIVGNGSSGTSLRWFADRAASTLPVATAWSVPMLVYRLAMLVWSLWLAASLLGWIRLGFRHFGAGGYWRELIKPRPPRTPTAPSTITVPEAPAGAPTSASPMSMSSTVPPKPEPETKA